MVDINTKIIETDKGFRIQAQKDDVKKLSDFDLMQMIHERDFDFCLDKDDYKVNFNKMNDSQKTLCAIFVIVGDIDNGGFIQFFQNTKDEFFEVGINGFNLIGDNETVKIFSEAIEIYKKNEDFLSASNLESNLDDKDEKNLEELDNKFHILDEKRDKKLIKFVKKYLDDFIVFK